MVKLISFPVLVGILCISSLTANATATGTLFLAQVGVVGEIYERPPILIAETVFFIAMALIILVKLLDYVVRERYRSNKRDAIDVKPIETSKGGRNKSTEQDEHKPTG